MTIDLQKHYDILHNNYILIITSNSKEKDAVNRLISNRNNLEIHMPSKGCSIGVLEGAFIVHLTGTSGSVEPLSVSRLVVEFISRTNLPTPALVLMCGFCWGNPSLTSIGNVILCSHILSLNSAKLDADKVVYKRKEFTSSISTEFLSDDLSSLLPSIVLGELASMETLFSSTKQRDELLSQFNTVIGGEMEGFGFIPSLNSIPWLIIKTVSDFGDDNFAREEQIESAKSAAGTLPIIISLLIDRELINLSNTGPSELLLMDLLVGNTIKVSNNNFNSDSLNDFLNNQIGPLIVRKLEFYLVCDEYDKKFSRRFCDLILEVLQNSFKHSGATIATITFHPKNFIINDDGDEFDLHNLAGDRGGANSWRRVKAEFIDKGLVNYSHKKGNHQFKLVKANETLRKAIDECSVSINESAIGSGFRKRDIISYNDECEILYVDDRSILMSSRRNAIINCVEELLKNGKTVYVAVSDKYDAEEYQTKLGKYSDKLKIILE